MKFIDITDVNPRHSSYRVGGVMIQLILKPESITVTMTVFEAVLTTRTFEGIDCYGQFLRFLDE